MHEMKVKVSQTETRMSMEKSDVRKGNTLAGF